MNLKLENFIVDEKIKELANELLDSETDTSVTNALKSNISIGELKKLRTFIKCQKRDIGNNFTAIAIYISTIALVLPAIEKLLGNNIYILVSISIAIGLIWSLFKDGVPFINKTNEFNSKVDYLLWLIDEELIIRGDI